MTTTERRLRKDALAIVQAALKAGDGGSAVVRAISSQRNRLKVGTVVLPPASSFNRVFALAVGKAAAAMAMALEKQIGPALHAGLVVTKHGHTATVSPKWTVREAGHPVPDDAGAAAAIEAGSFLRELNARDLLLVAVSGGASALLPAPSLPITLKDKAATTNLLLRCGAVIGELNAVRKHLSWLKGGRLAALAYPATVVGLLLSDVVGDHVDIIGSGLTAPDDSTFADALAVLRRYGLSKRVPRPVLRHLEAGAKGLMDETPKRNDPIFKNVHNVVIGSNRLALQVAAAQAKLLGYQTRVLSSTLSGETREVAAVHAGILREMKASGQPIRPPACLLSGGETTVTIRGNGRGGRNQEFALAAAIGIESLSDVVVLSAGTDGTDGPTDAAGALATGDTVRRGRRLGLEASEHLANNNAYPFFEALGDLLKTGPTGTNVMDIHLLLSR